jgi:hypothetical protein
MCEELYSPAGVRDGTCQSLWVGVGGHRDKGREGRRDMARDRESEREREGEDTRRQKRCFCHFDPSKPSSAQSRPVSGRQHAVLSGGTWSAPDG